ncbi:hypothetical protein PHAVU_L001859 [Phaseolus vulgaris]|uniref:Uncharacterized protein n=2 Tax=Phaseolus vulgaris TaxID=3885 RepID=V7BGQ7_PHAVU|nr:hypothetical protein PHAVU_007G126900g [Phaseolus vulgaris]ESW16073.1 hypothetical protein PHAVU_007G126900g [Phaseolus vulgaris]
MQLPPHPQFLFSIQCSIHATTSFLPLRHQPFTPQHLRIASNTSRTSFSPHHHDRPLIATASDISLFFYSPHPHLFFSIQRFNRAAASFLPHLHDTVLHFSSPHAQTTSFATNPFTPQHLRTASSASWTIFHLTTATNHLLSPCQTSSSFSLACALTSSSPSNASFALHPHFFLSSVTPCSTPLLLTAKFCSHSVASLLPAKTIVSVLTPTNCLQHLSDLFFT